MPSRVNDSPFTPLALNFLNYFAHAVRFLDRPWFIAGAAVPDWLGVVNRRCRVRRKTVLQHLDAWSGTRRELALGILQHLDDDQWFHGTPAFFQLTGAIAANFRSRAAADEEWRCGFLGHLTLELLIDAELISRQPGLLEDYYEALRSLDPAAVEEVVGTLSSVPPHNLGLLIPRFIDERFLADYIDDARLLRRINQVLRRVGLTPLSQEVLPVFEESRPLIRERLQELLPEGTLESFPATVSR